jgi:hypothetical protein
MALCCACAAPKLTAANNIAIRRNLTEKPPRILNFAITKVLHTTYAVTRIVSIGRRLYETIFYD